MQTFVPWSALHLAVLVTIGALVASAVRLRRQASEPSPLPAERAAGALYLVLWIGTFTLLAGKPDHQAATELPLQLCHWAAVSAALALLTSSRVWRVLAYFWGLGLCTQALVTPGLTEGPASWPFWFFWTTHAMTVGVPLYDVLARGLRPTWRDFAIAAGGAAAYVAIVLPVDLATGWNYGFVGPSRPDGPTIIDLLGRWPQRLGWIALIASGAMALLMLPFLGITRTRGPWRRARRA